MTLLPTGARRGAAAGSPQARTATVSPLVAAVGRLGAALSDELWPRARARQAARLIDRWPADLAVGVIAEARLGDDPQVDVSLAINRDAFARLGRWAGSQPSAAWSGVHRLAATHEAPGSPLTADLACLWLELDLVGAELESPEPSVFLTLERHAGRVTVVTLDFLSAAFASLHPRGGTAAAATAGLLAQLPAGGRLVHVGAMLSRPVPTLRLCLWLPTATIDPYLAAVGWPGDRTALSALLESLAPRVDTVVLNLDLTLAGEAADGAGAQLDPGFGLELLMSPGPAAAERWSALLDVLATAGLVTPRRARRCLELTAARPSPLVRINHLKVVSRPPAPLAAKIYLWTPARTGAGALPPSNDRAGRSDGG